MLGGEVARDHQEAWIGEYCRSALGFPAVEFLNKV
jgi:hypothetical protein